jgi:flagellar hook-length control protein FliK
VADIGFGWSEEAENAIPSIHASDPAGLRKATEIAAGAGAAASADPVRNVAIQVVAAVGARASGTFEIQLDPEELGRVTLTLQVTDDAVVLVIQAERQDTLDLMRRHADILQREFREAGFSSLTFSFGQNSQDGRSMPSRADVVPIGDGGSGSEADRPLPAAGRGRASSRLDVRV